MLGMVLMAFVSVSGCADPATTVSVVINAPIEDVFAYTVAEDVLPKVLKRYGPIPAIVRTEMLHGPWERVGADRRVFMEGGGTLHEQITHFQAPTFFAYQISDFEGTSLRALASRGKGSWVFTPQGEATLVAWTYAFSPRSAWVRPVMSTFLHSFYRGFMKQTLRIMKEDLEKERAALQAALRVPPSKRQGGQEPAFNTQNGPSL